MLQKILIWGAASVAIFVLSLATHRKDKPQEVLEEANYPLSDYLFIPPQQKPAQPDQKDYQRLQEQLKADALKLQQLQAKLQQTAPSPPPTQEPSAPPDGDTQALLASRIQAFGLPTKESLEAQNAIDLLDYGSGGFENLKTKDMATHENKLLRTITADKMIPAFLITPISSQLAGKVIAQVESDIFASMGKAVLIPKGSKVIGYYNNNNKIGEYRLDIVWTRIITPQGVNIMLTNAKSADVKGYSGLVGEMMTHNFQRYGIPLLASTLSNGLLIALTSTIANKTGRNNFFGDYLLMQLTRQSGMGLNQIIAQILKDKSNLKPVVVIREGSRVFISPNLDIFFPIPREGEVLAEFFTH